VDAQRWLRELRAELARRKLPPLYPRRLVEELSDHPTDSVENRMSTDAKDLHGVFERLDQPQALASRAAIEFRKQRFSRRHPILMFVVLPILALPLLWFSSLAIIVMLIAALGLETGSPAIGGTVWRVANACLPFVVVGLLIVPVTLAATFFCRLARRATLSWKWTLSACLLLAMISGLAAIDVMLPEAKSQGHIMFGLSLSQYPTASQTLQFLLPLSIGGWAAWRQVAGSRRAAAA